ncbi:MAG: radical SAM protein [Desulfobacteraceae bacterium]|nr:radical SAM protein [Desulfobacteraceae bacterium]MDH3572966.1 radical SAM protein [Desulfobacteraceae bacterium]MDH3721458.1 radical SAM protein [Desulfobacteraceae bacterium]MDH3838152.1 radical SAM protein [Desulfobacteraceae bacterium]MDH3875446.1 radical SAM protein [Desulfobacteraceae bacterium]
MKKTVAFSKNATNVFFHILTDCNLKCRHCYINKKQHGKNTLPLETINAWLSVFASKNKEANVIFLGGEPTLHPNLPEAVNKAKSLGYSSITIDTNGYLFHDILSRVSPDVIDYFSFSLDGTTRETNDMIRGKGSFDTCIQGIKNAVLKGFSTSLIYTVSTKNIHELDKIAPLLKDLKINRFFIQVIGIRGKSAGSRKDKLQVSRKDWLKIVPDAAQKIARLGIIVTYPKVFLSLEEPFECAGLVADNYFIFPNGRVYRCPLCEDYPLHSSVFKDNVLANTPRINENDFFTLNIPEGCVMNKLFQPDNLSYNPNGTCKYKIACCMLKEEIRITL